MRLVASMTMNPTVPHQAGEATPNPSPGSREASTDRSRVITSSSRCGPAPDQQWPKAERRADHDAPRRKDPENEAHAETERGGKCPDCRARQLDAPVRNGIESGREQYLPFVWWQASHDGPIPLGQRGPFGISALDHRQNGE